MERKQPRKRIPIRTTAPVVADPLAFQKNKSSDRARSITTIDELITIELWFDKHYVDRHQHGDDNGKREGIEAENVEELVLQAIKHMLFYSSYLKNFTFLNYNGIGADSDRAIRIVCQKEFDDELLNVVIECHYSSLNSYEITVKTAMRTNDFKLSDGQYAIEVLNEDNSYLKKMTKGRLSDICAI